MDQHLLGVMNRIGHTLGTPAYPAFLSMFSPSPNTVLVLGEADLLIRFRNILRVGVTANKPSPESPHRGLHLAVMGSGIVVSQGASLVGKDVNVMVDDGAVPG